jgi:hypothetical protein
VASVAAVAASDTHGKTNAKGHECIFLFFVSHRRFIFKLNHDGTGR